MQNRERPAQTEATRKRDVVRPARATRLRSGNQKKLAHLQELARQADAGETVQLSGKSRDEIRALLFP